LKPEEDLAISNMQELEAVFQQEFESNIKNNPELHEMRLNEKEATDPEGFYLKE